MNGKVREFTQFTWFTALLFGGDFLVRATGRTRVQAVYLITCQYLPNLPGFGRLAAGDVCRIADLQQLHKFMAGYGVVKVRFIARLIYIRWMGNAREVKGLGEAIRVTTIPDQNKLFLIWARLVSLSFFS